MRSVNFDDLDDEDGTEPPVRPAAGAAAPTAEPPAADHLTGTGTAESPAGVFSPTLSGDAHEALTFGPLPAPAALTGDGSIAGDATGEALDPLPDSAYPPGAAELPVDIPAKPARSIYEAEHALQSPSRSLADSFDTVVKNVHRLTPGQVEVLHAVLMELGADLDVDGAAGYGPEFDMTAFIQRMIKTTKAIENRLYRPGEDGMQPAFSAQELGAITNANKNLLMMIAKNHDKVMGWERQRAIEAAHMAAARDLPADIQDRYLAKLQAELEARGL